VAQREIAIEIERERERERIGVRHQCIFLGAFCGGVRVRERREWVDKREEEEEGRKEMGRRQQPT